ncbi:hypothetical protein M1141_01405 [Candidatus Marsarchaeota archaeon]|nr:hypothetical protein [Candidatus Marsarchaeota archaeon]
MKYMQKVISTFKGPDYPVFTINSMRILLKKEKIGKAYLYLLLHNMFKKRLITRITNGIYTFHDDAVVAGFAFEPFYYGLECALWLRGISGHGTNYIIMTSRNIRSGLRSFKKRNYIVHRINNKYMFGYELLNYGDFWIPVADIEKTFIDMVYYKHVIRDELAYAIAKQINRKRLKAYAAKYPSGFSAKVANQLQRIAGMK